MRVGIESRALRSAELRSERIRVRATLAVFASVFVLLVIRAVMALAAGRRGEAWPFALLLFVATAYEILWLRFVERAVESDRPVARRAWALNILFESLLPTMALFLQVKTPSIGPAGTLSSPVVLVYLLFILLSTLHLSRSLCWLAGAFSAAGYGSAALFAISALPDSAAARSLTIYSNLFGYLGFLLIAGFAAGVVARQIRGYMITALEEAETRAKVEQDLAVARTIQQGLLPKRPPTLDGFDIAGWNRAADETGGDYYDWQELTDNRLAITIADATGHGIGPALIMSACRAYTRSSFSRTNGLCGFLSQLNTLLYEDLPRGKFVTLVGGLVDPASPILQLTSAGHGPLFHYSSAEDRFNLLDSQGPPLGLLPAARFAEPYQVAFSPGDILVLVTDGFLEWPNATDEDFGADRLMDVVRRHRESSAADIISELYLELIRFAGSGQQPDDLTALVVKRS